MLTLHDNIVEEIRVIYRKYDNWLCESSWFRFARLFNRTFQLWNEPVDNSYRYLYTFVYKWWTRSVTPSDIDAGFTMESIFPRTYSWVIAKFSNLFTHSSTLCLDVHIFLNRLYQSVEGNDVFFKKVSTFFPWSIHGFYEKLSHTLYLPTVRAINKKLIHWRWGHRCN